MTDRDPLDLAYADGWIARREGKGLDANPYQGGPLLPARIVCHPAIRSA